ncbi:MAG: N-6 DNA methylase, partial [Actinomycetota bacterium]|nr:N-6 DNA methylase [Actinomycetota bacterium]
MESKSTNEDLIQELANLGRLREEALTHHRATGAIFTPYPIARELTDLLTIDAGDVVCDPSAGPGIFLLAAAERKFQMGESV